jgi:hypothetical protein
MKIKMSHQKGSVETKEKKRISANCFSSHGGKVILRKKNLNVY